MNSTSELRQPSTPDATAPTPHTTPHADMMIAHLQEEVSYLRERLEDAMGQLAEERRRADVLQREALGRIEALSSTSQRHDIEPEATDPPERVGEDAKEESVETARHTRLAGILARLRRLIAGDR